LFFPLIGLGAAAPGHRNVAAVLRHLGQDITRGCSELSQEAERWAGLGDVTAQELRRGLKGLADLHIQAGLALERLHR